MHKISCEFACRVDVYKDKIAAANAFVYQGRIYSSQDKRMQLSIVSC